MTLDDYHKEFEKRVEEIVSRNTGKGTRHPFAVQFALEELKMEYSAEVARAAHPLHIARLTLFLGWERGYSASNA